MSEPAEQRTGERRRVARHKTLLRGQISFNNRRAAIDCLIRDISPLGARLIFTDPVTIPDAIDLHIPQKDQTLRAQVHWRNGTEIGVGFVAASIPGTETTGELVERVQRLEAEVAALKKLMKKLKTSVDGEEAA